MLGVNANEGALFLFKEFPQDFDGRNPVFADVVQTRFLEMIETLSLGLSAAQIAGVAFEYQTPYRFADRKTWTNFAALDSILGDYVFKCPLINFSLTYAPEAG